jgi:replicative DNA helicase
VWAFKELALAQVNRAATSRRDGRPTLADLRESGAIEADADSVILLHTDEDQPHVVEAIVAKGRSTAKGQASLQMQGHYSRLVGSTWTPHSKLEETPA